MWMVEDWKIPISRYVQSRTSKFQVMGHQSSKSPKALTSRFHAIMPFVLIPHPQKLNDVSRQVQLKMQVANDNQVVLPKDWSMLSSWGLSRRSWELASLCLAASIPWWLTSKERFWMSGFLLWCLKLWCWSFDRVGPGTQGVGRWIFGIWEFFFGLYDDGVYLTDWLKTSSSVKTSKYLLTSKAWLKAQITKANPLRSCSKELNNFLLFKLLLILF